MSSVRAGNLFRTLAGFLLAWVIAHPAFGGAPPANYGDGGRKFRSPEDAVQALVQAAKAGDTNSIQAIFGPGARELVSPDLVQATLDRETFLRRLTEKVEAVRQSESQVILTIGQDGWAFPIPLVERQGEWVFDAESGKEEILNRRIGRNEMNAIQVCRAYVEAQNEYAREDHNHDGVLEYAQHLRSSPGTEDGLYWPVQPGEEASPFGPLIAEARAKGYRRQVKALNEPQTPYQGYYFKILTKQGKHTPGGKYDYVINGHMIAGFALVAWPSERGNTGIMTFLVNQQGKVYQKDLGPKTAALAQDLTRFDPDSTWTLVSD